MTQILSIGKTPIQQELDDVNRRYEALRKGLGDSLEDLRVAERCEEEKAFIDNADDWCLATLIKMEECKPRSNEIDPLAEELEVFKVGGSNLFCNNGFYV